MYLYNKRDWGISFRDRGIFPRRDRDGDRGISCQDRSDTEALDSWSCVQRARHWQPKLRPRHEIPGLRRWYASGPRHLNRGYIWQTCTAVLSDASRARTLTLTTRFMHDYSRITMNCRYAHNPSPNLNPSLLYCVHSRQNSVYPSKYPSSWDGYFGTVILNLGLPFGVFPSRRFVLWFMQFL